MLEVAPDSATVEEEVMTTMEETEIVTSDETAHLVTPQHISPKIHRKSHVLFFLLKKMFM